MTGIGPGDLQCASVTLAAGGNLGEGSSADLDGRRNPTLAEWLRWPTGRLSRWVSDLPAPLVMAWPFDGTRRWYLSYALRHPNAPGDYLTVTARRQAELHRMVLAHGVSVLLVPLFGTELLRRGRAYVEYALGGLKLLRDDAVYQKMYDAGVRVRFYGDYEEALGGLGLPHALQACRELTASTAKGDGPLLLFGLFADDPYATLARLSVEFASEGGRPPDRRELIEAYYGLPVPDLGFYLGFARHALFDVPLLATGEEDLYATLGPSPDLTEPQLRGILYDHLVERRRPEPDYEGLSLEALIELDAYAERSRGKTLGVGRTDPTTGMWRPLLPETQG